MPEDWEREKTKDGNGVVYKDPNSDGTYVKIQKANPKSSNTGQQYDNVRWQKNGQSYDVNGNKVPRKSLESHIPAKDFEFDPELFR